MGHNGDRKTVAYDDLESRKRLTFRQAEGIDPLPTQMKREEITPVLKARLWDVLYSQINPSRTLVGPYTGFAQINENWALVLREEWIGRRGKLAHLFQDNVQIRVKDLSEIFQKRTAAEIFQLIQFLLRAGANDTFKSEVAAVLEMEQSAFRVVGGDTLMPTTSKEELGAIRSAFQDTSENEFKGSHTHLKLSAIALGEGKFADSVRESIHAVESVARVLEPNAKLSKALAVLENAGHLHPSMKNGFNALYGWTSDDNGIRHALLEDGDAKVDETDALFMIGACSSFVSYLIAKRKAAGISR
jgi:hypothetical protein